MLLSFYILSCYQLLKYHSSYKMLKRHFRNLIKKNYAESEEFWWESTCSSTK